MRAGHRGAVTRKLVDAVDRSGTRSSQTNSGEGDTGREERSVERIRSGDHRFHRGGGRLDRGDLPSRQNERRYWSNVELGQ